MPGSRVSRRYSRVLLVAALPVWMAAQFTACPFLATLHPPKTYTETFDACEACAAGTYRDFNDPTNPEDDVAVDFEITSPDALETTNAYVEITLRCGNGVGGHPTVPVTLKSAGPNTLTGHFEGNAKSLCAPDFGERSPGLWTVYVKRTIPNQSVTFKWTVSYREYVN